MLVAPNITQTAGDNQHVENHHRYDCEWNQVLHNRFHLQLFVMSAAVARRRFGVARQMA